MINVKQAANALHKKYPNLTITDCAELPKHWLFSAVENPNEVDYNCPFYAVSKSSGIVGSYTPLDDFENFSNAKHVNWRE